MADTNQCIVILSKAHLINYLLGIHSIIEPSIYTNKTVSISSISLWVTRINYKCF